MTGDEGVIKLSVSKISLHFKAVEHFEKGVLEFALFFHIAVGIYYIKAVGVGVYCHDVPYLIGLADVILDLTAALAVKIALVVTDGENDVISADIAHQKVEKIRIILGGVIRNIRLFLRGVGTVADIKAHKA